MIGKGSYGVVCAARDNFTGEKVAIKKIQNVFENVADATRILREIKLLRLLKQPDVVEVKHVLLPSDPRNFQDIYVVFELMESDLHTVIGANDDLTPDHHKVFLYQLLRGLAYIHASGVLHRDLKPKNILANSNCKLKICDFGLARPFMADTAMTPVFWTDYVATRWYRAPELCGCFYGRYSQAVDIWSVGCIFAEVLTGRPLFPGRDAVSQLQLITDLMGKPTPAVIERISNQRARAFLNAMPAKEPRPFASRFPNADPAGLDLLRRLLAFDPSARPSAADALLDPYFAGLPAATMASEPQPVCRDGAFDFEMRSKLEEAEVRSLIYAEVLHYHPGVAAAYAAGGRSVTTSPLVAGSGLQDLKRQFAMAEQTGQAATATAKQHKQDAPPRQQQHQPPQQQQQQQQQPHHQQQQSDQQQYQQQQHQQAEQQRQQQHSQATGVGQNSRSQNHHDPGANPSHSHHTAQQYSQHPAMRATDQAARMQYEQQQLQAQQQQLMQQQHMQRQQQALLQQQHAQQQQLQQAQQQYQYQQQQQQQGMMMHGGISYQQQSPVTPMGTANMYAEEVVATVHSLHQTHMGQLAGHKPNGSGALNATGCL
ncbi:MAG: hypothetical protein WDW38_002390 [Sanguina aurantia]